MSVETVQNVPQMFIELHLKSLATGEWPSMSFKVIGNGMSSYIVILFDILHSFWDTSTFVFTVPVTLKSFSFLAHSWEQGPQMLSGLCIPWMWPRSWCLCRKASQRLMSVSPRSKLGASTSRSQARMPRAHSLICQLLPFAARSSDRRCNVQAMASLIWESFSWLS